MDIEVPLIATTDDLPRVVLPDHRCRLGLQRLPASVQLQIWRHLEYPHFKALAVSCQRLRASVESTPLSQIGAPMVVSALLCERLHVTPSADDAVKRFRFRRASSLTAYLAVIGIGLPTFIMTWPSSQPWSLNMHLVAIYLSLAVGTLIAATAPLEPPCSGEGSAPCGGRAALQLRFRAREEIYTTSQLKMLRQLWLCYSLASLLTPWLGAATISLIILGLIAPVLAAAVGIVIVRRAMVPGPLRVSFYMQVCWLSALLLSVICGAAARQCWLAQARAQFSHVAVLVGMPWSAATIVFAPKVLRQLVPWERPASGTQHTAAMTATAAPRCSSFSFCVHIKTFCFGKHFGSIDMPWQRWRHTQISWALFVTRLLVLWVLLPQFTEAALQRPPPAMLPCLPPIVLSIFAIVTIWRPSWYPTRQHVVQQQT